MHAGTLAMCDPVSDEPLRSWRSESGFPALSVQDTLGESGVQLGQAATRVQATRREVYVTGTDTPSITVEPEETVERVATAWIADVRETGLVIAESIGTAEAFPFPFDLVTARTGAECRRHTVDVRQLGDDWQTAGRLKETWMVGGEDGQGSSIQYHEHAERTAARDATFGLGFKTAWDGSIAHGVVYSGGYLSVYNDWPTARFVRFVDAEIAPYAEPVEPDETDGRQPTLGEVSG